MKSQILAAVIAASLVPSLSVVRAASVAENWTKHCASCHGKDGKADTKAGKKAGAKDLTDPKVQAEFDDAKGFSAIKDGVKDGSKVKMKPAVGLSDAEIKALVTYVRGLKK
jgi:mono/diheme cytochrome c family protein